MTDARKRAEEALAFMDAALLSEMPPLPTQVKALADAVRALLAAGPEAGVRSVGPVLAMARYDEEAGTFNITHVDTAPVAPTPTPEPAPHQWGRWTQGQEWDSCRACGIVRRADDQNKPCRGPVTVALRSASPPPSDAVRCAWCGAALAQDPDAPHRWRCDRAVQEKCVARGYWYVLGDDLAGVREAALVTDTAGTPCDAVREAAEIVRTILTAHDARLSESGVLTYGPPSKGTGFVAAIQWLRRYDAARGGE